MGPIATDWVGDYLDRLFASWRARADTPSGLFDPYLDRQWRRRGGGPRTLVSQSRLIYVFCRAYERSGDEAYADLARRGIAALIRSFKDPQGDGWVWACRGDGAVADDTWDAYGHAFVILALATAATVFDDDRHRDLALETWDFMRRRLRDDRGGLIWRMRRDGGIPDALRSQNPLMHAFEALLVLAPLDDSGTTRRDAGQIWTFLQARMLGPGRLPEWCEPDWRPVAAGPRAVIDAGHAFEWAFLLSEAQPLFPDDDLLAPGRQFLAFGMRHGYDPADGGIVS
ncbi:MAG TPA: AGE family epimerase/isomerase, partial [Thermomicrobiales bacterium]|nr:AGE family epimerase/isomerase [Thermomicrobiales bacterium]